MLDLFVAPAALSLTCERSRSSDSVSSLLEEPPSCLGALGASSLRPADSLAVTVGAGAGLGGAVPEGCRTEWKHTRSWPCPS